MTTERRRLALVGLCIVAVALGAALFPAAGFGSVPGDGASGGSGPGGGDNGAPPASTPTATATETPTDAPLPSDDGSRFDSPTPTPTPTDEERSGPPPGLPRDPPTGPVEWFFGNLPLVAVVGAIGTAVLYALYVVGERSSGRLAEHDSSGGDGTLSLLLSPVTLVKRISQGTMVVLVGFATLSARALAAAGSAAEAVGAVARALVGDREWTGPSPLRALVRAARAPFAGLSALSLSAVPGVFSAVTAAGSTDASSTQRTDGRVATPVEPPADDDPAEEPDPTTVTEAWELLTDAVRVDDPESTTPTEYARAAVEQGLPAEPVGRLARAFRRVRYGARRPTAARTDAALDAAERIRGTLDASDDAGDTDASDDAGDTDAGDDADRGSDGGDA